MAALDVAIVGAGIVGLAHAWSAAERGHRVTVFERSQKATGASIRNFGMVWPIGQPPGDLHRLALLSRKRWLQLADSSDIWVNRCGSIHLAHRPDEWDVLREFAKRAPSLGYECALLSPEEVCLRTQAANPDRLIGGLLSPTELAVNPPATIRALPGWLASRFGVATEFGVGVSAVTSESGSRPIVHRANAQPRTFDRVVVCGGIDVPLLFPELYADSGLRACKLQMLRTVPQPNGWRTGPHLASGLTLRHYRNFEICPSLNALKRRVATETPELDRYGIHVMASQNDVGEVILGDSHEYGNEIEPFDKLVIDELILRELWQIVRLPTWSIAERWHGVYAKHPDLPIFEAEPLPEVHVCTGAGGAGMTMSFGLVEAAWQRWTNER